MTDYTELQKAAEYAAQDTIKFADEDKEMRALQQFHEEVDPETVLALIAESARLQSAAKTLERLGYRDNGGELWKPPLGQKPDLSLMDQLKAENEALRNALAECINSLKGEMLQKFGGQLPEDMHHVTRREYDRDVAELYGYRAALGKGDHS